jgi:hypothetical protein
MKGSDSKNSGVMGSRKPRPRRTRLWMLSCQSQLKSAEAQMSFQLTPGVIANSKTQITIFYDYGK